MAVPRLLVLSSNYICRVPCVTDGRLPAAAFLLVGAAGWEVLSIMICVLLKCCFMRPWHQQQPTLSQGVWNFQVCAMANAFLVDLDTCGASITEDAMDGLNSVLTRKQASTQHIRQSYGQAYSK